MIDLSVPMSPQSQYLSPEEFESLNKAVQLLRISQLRYIVQKFSIPASGNKTKLLSLVLSIFQSIRYDKGLIEVLQEVNRLLAQTSDPFSNPLAGVGHLALVDPDPSFAAPFNPLVVQAPDSVVFGPLLAAPGQFTGKFTFSCPSRSNPVNVCFLFPDAVCHQFGFKADLNGYPFEIAPDDPFPQPLDVTHVLNVGHVENSLEVKLLISTVPMMICIREYRFVGLQGIVSQICRRDVDWPGERIDAVSSQCDHPGTFQLVPFLARAIATENWSCPTCHRRIDIESIQEARPASAGARPAPASTVDIFQHGPSDSFMPQLDWFDF
jgi:hypothetical protein